MQAEHHPFRMSWTDSTFTHRDTSIHTHRMFQIRFFLFTGSTDLILEITSEDVNFARFSYIRLCQVFLNQSKVLPYADVIASLQAKKWWRWLLNAIAHRSSHSPPQISSLAEEREAIDVLHHFRCLSRLLVPMLQMLAEALRNGPPHQPQPQSSLPALLSTA